MLRTPATPFVGRAHELGELQAHFARTRDERTCQLVTVAGPPGIGKSRLAGEFLATLGDDVTVLVGRCLAYGEGTTLGALADLVRGLGRFPRRRVEELLADDEPALRAVLSAVGLSDEPVRAEETSWAMRRLLQRLARDHPLVVAVEDIHWAEPALLDQLDHVVALASGSPILLLCLTRPELLENPAGVGRATAHRFVVVLDALADEEALELAGHPNEAVGYGAFAIGERVVVVGAATHDLSSYPTPYLWEGTFTVEDENQPSSLPGIRGRDVDTPDPASLAPTS